MYLLSVHPPVIYLFYHLSTICRICKSFICSYLSLHLSPVIYLMYLSFHPSIHVSVYVSIYPSILYLSVSLSIHPSICLSIHPSMYLSIHPSVCLIVCLSTYLSIHPSICLSVCLPTYLSIHPSICLSIFLSVCHLPSKSFTHNTLNDSAIILILQVKKHLLESPFT